MSRYRGTLFLLGVLAFLGLMVVLSRAFGTWVTWAFIAAAWAYLILSTFLQEHRRP